MPADSAEEMRQLPRGRHGLPRELVARSQRERLLAAVVRVTAAQGYDSTTVGDVLAEAGVGRESFYELFDDKLGCMLAAHSILVEDLEGQVESAYLESGPWPERLARAIGAALEWFATNPEAARFGLIELRSIGPAYRDLFKADFDRFVALIDRGLSEGDPRPALPQGSCLAVCATIVKVSEELRAGRAAELPDLLPDLSYEALVPLVGEEAARRLSRSARR
jgi:AcrR family transcriptional regulator